MENRNNKIWVIAGICTLAMTAGCGISITRNQYYGNPTSPDKPPTIEETKHPYQADTEQKKE